MNILTTKYSIHTNACPAHYTYSYEQTLYHRNDYLSCQAKPPQFSFWLCKPQTATIEGVIHFHLQDKKASSHLFAPFGSFDGRPLLKAMAVELLDHIQKILAEQGVLEMEVRHRPGCYDHDTHWVASLEESGFLAHQSINHHLMIDGTPFKRKIHLMERRKLSKCKQFHFTVSPKESLNEVYYFIKACRMERNQSLSMTLDELQQVAVKLPGQFMLCTVYSGLRLAAAAIVIKVSSRYWYQFYPAHSAEFNRESPLVFLISELYQYAHEQGVEILDLGTSEVERQPIEGLLTFKKRIGGVKSWKTTYSKVI